MMPIKDFPIMTQADIDSRLPEVEKLTDTSEFKAFSALAEKLGFMITEVEVTAWCDKAVDASGAVLIAIRKSFDSKTVAIQVGRTYLSQME